MKYNC